MAISQTRPMPRIMPVNVVHHRAVALVSWNGPPIGTRAGGSWSLVKDVEVESGKRGDQTLHRGVEGYDDYARGVRRHLVPLIVLRPTEATIKMGYHGGTKTGGDENDQEDIRSA
jgi:hypothetical protein